MGGRASQPYSCSFSISPPYLTNRRGCQTLPATTPGLLIRPGRHPHRKIWHGVSPPLPTRPDLLRLLPPIRYSDAPLRPPPHLKRWGTAGPLGLPPENLVMPPCIIPPREPPSKTCPCMRKGCGRPEVPRCTPPGSPGICPCPRRHPFIVIKLFYFLLCLQVYSLASHRHHSVFTKINNFRPPDTAGFCHGIRNSKLSQIF